MCKKLKEWQTRTLTLFKSYHDLGVWSTFEFEEARNRVLNPPDWFIKHLEKQ